MLAIFLSALTCPLLAAAPGDIFFERKDATAEDSAFPPTLFPHWVHRIRYRCDACHDTLFQMETGATEVSMALIAEGKVCGACHDGKRAFGTGFENCQRCHRQPD